MKKIGICGSIGSGKSFICDKFKKWDIPVFKFDDVAKHVMISEANIISNIKKNFGNVYDNDFKLKKEKLGSIIFNNDFKRKQLEDIIRPELLKSYYEFCYVQEYDNNKSMIIAESATMFNSNLFKLFDNLILVNANYDKRKSIVLKNRKISNDDFDRRNNKQKKLYDIIFELEKNNIKYDVYENNYSEMCVENFVLEYIKNI